MLDNLLQLYPLYTKWYGPTFHEKEGRSYIYLYNKDTQARTTISYAKALIQCELNRLLTNEEVVDHIDDNKLNDTIENLQIITQQENNRKGKFSVVECAFCKKKFEKLNSRIRQRASFINATKYYCNKSCLGLSKRK